MNQFLPGFLRHAALAVILLGSVVGCNLSAPTGGSPTGGSAGGSTGSGGPGGSAGGVAGGSTESNAGNPDTGGNTVGPGGNAGGAGGTNQGGINIVGGAGGTTFAVGGGGAAGGNGGVTVVGGNGGTILVGGTTSTGGSKSPGSTTGVGGATIAGGSKSPGGTTSVGGSSASSSSGGSTVVKAACTVGPTADPKMMPGYPADQHTKFQTQASTTVLSLSVTEKAQQMRGTDPGPSTSRNWTDTFRQPDNTSKSIKGFTFRDGPRGVNLDAPIQATNTSHGKSTVFPVAMARGAAWDVNLEYQIGQAIGDEMAAASQTMLLAPTVNLLRHPLWGRAQETYGEDPYQLGRLGTSLVAGVQTYVPACAKHYAANNIENQRASKNSSMDEQTLREIYARHFEMIVKDGGVACIMAAYNLVNGTSCTQNAHLLNDILRTDFGFNGFVMSDWWAMPGGNGASPNATLAGQAIAAGMDMELPWSLNFSTIEGSIGSAINQTQVDTAVKRILEQKYRFGVDKGTGLKAATTGFSGGSITGNDAHVTLAQTAALESMVLLKNDNALPIKSTFTKIAVVGLTQSYCAPVNSSGVATGPGINNCSDDVNNGTINFATGIRVGDVGSSRVDFDSSKAVGPFAGIQSAAGSGVTVTSGSTAASAAGADFIVVVAGLTPYDEGEEYNGSGDRTTLALDGKMNSGAQNGLITAVAALGKPMVVVLEGGSVIDMPWFTSLPPVSAVVMAWYPGMTGGTALGKLLFGKANFSGKLPISWPSQLSDLPTFNGGATTTMDYYVGYRYYDNKNITPKFAFGYGLSYTQFTYSNLVVPCGTASQSAVVNVSVDVTNSGTVAGDEVVFLFVSYPGTTKKRPVKELKGFARVTIAAGAKQTVTIPVRVADLKYWDSTSSKWAIEASTVKVMVGPSSANLPLSDTFTVTSTP
jgi:beta-glucosidase